METNDFLKDIDTTPVNWDEIDTAKLENDCDQTPVDSEFENYLNDLPDDLNHILDVIELTENEIQKKCRLLNEGIYNTMHKKIYSLVKLDDDYVYNKVIDSTIRYKNTRHFNDLYSLYKKLGSEDIRKFCYTEIHSMYCRQVQQLMLGVRKQKNDQIRNTRNEQIFNLIDSGMKYADIAAKFGLSEISIKKLA